MQGIRKDTSGMRSSISGLNPKMMRALKNQSGFANAGTPNTNYGSTRNLGAQKTESKLHSQPLHY